jgi:DNA sulfur modification protein DndC
MSLEINDITKEIIDQYLNDENPRPWIIGFSGGKDSTMLLQLVWNAIKNLDPALRARTIYVVCNDTQVENPTIAKYVDNVLIKIQDTAPKEDMPVFVHKTRPTLEDSFWTNLIGKGYPAPNNAFRWCTDRLKISPTTRFILDKIGEEGEAIILLGTRSDESSSRARSIRKNTRTGERLRKHPLPNAYVYAPISDVLVDDLWQYLLQVPSPWGANNKELVTMYRNASGGDCPLVIDTTTPSCGNSRFGCWVCTVVKKDKSMEGLITSGEEWLEPMLDFRDMLVETRNIREGREKRRRNSFMPVDENDPDSWDWGPYTPQFRANYLKELLQVQRTIQDEYEQPIELITNQELVAIQVNWHRDSIFNFSVAEIYNQVYGTEYRKKDFDDQSVFEKELLKENCSEKDFRLIEELLEIQKSKTILRNKIGLQNDIERHIERHLNGLVS